MKRLNDWMIAMYVAMTMKIDEFKKREDGDTNFVSMLLIIGIVVVIAGLFLAFGKDVVSQISEKVTKFIKKLK